MAFGGLDGSCGLDGGFAAQKINASLLSAKNGIISVPTGEASLVTPDVDPTKINVAAGTGLIMNYSTTIADGRFAPRFVSWPAQVVDGPTVPPFDATDTVFPIVVDVNGDIGFVVNENTSLISPIQSLDYLQIGVISLDPVSRNILSLARGGNTPYSMTSDLQGLFTVLGSLNFIGATGREFVPNPGGLTVGVSSGYVWGFLGNFISDARVPNSSFQDAEPLVSLVALAEPDTGVFSFSGTAQLDPTKVAKNGLITAFADAGGGEVTVSAQGHGMRAGDTVQINNTINYNGRFVLASVTGNTYNITTTFVANDATGDWSGLTDVANFQFTGQRLLYFRTPLICAAYYGKAEYSTIPDYDIVNAEISEGFVEPTVTTNALATQILIIRQDVTDFADVVNYKIRKVTSRLKS